MIRYFSFNKTLQKVLASMTRGKLANLKETAKKAAASESREEKIEALSRAFALFSDESRRLEAAHANLKQKYQKLNVELKKTNERLNEKLHDLNITANYLKNILSNMSQGLLFVNRAGYITTYNKGAERIFERPAIDVLFHKAIDCFGQDFFGFQLTEVLESKKSPASTLVSYKPISAEESKELEIDARYVDSQDAMITQHLDETLDYTQGIILLIRDVTDIHKLKQLAERNERLKELGEMAAMVAHEIRNPLGGIKGFAALLERDLKSQPELQQMARYIMEGTESLNTLVTQVLNYARPVQPTFKPINLKELLEEVHHRILMDASLSKGIDLQLAMTEPVHAVIDAMLIQSALFNLLVNAIQAMPDGGMVSLFLESTKKEAIIRVTDTGIGIPEENLEKIFSPFFTTKSTGNGFGLTEVHKVVRAHDGRISVHSVVGKGTTFTIGLPLKQPISQERRI